MRFSKMAFIVCACIFLLSADRAHAAISFVGSFEGGSNPNTDTTINMVGLQQGDLVIVAAGMGDNDNAKINLVINSTGYTQVADLFVDDTQEANLAVWWKILGPTPDTSIIVEGNVGGGTDSSLAVVAMVFRGVDTTTPMDVTPTVSTFSQNSMHPNPPPIDHNNPSGVWTVIAGASGHTLGGAGTYTFPTGYTTNAADRGQDDTSDITVGMGYRDSGVSDPEDPGTMTHSGTNSTNFAWLAATIALRPQTTAAPTVTTSAESDVTATSATLNGSISATGGEDATVRGFAWGTSSTLQDAFGTSTESGTFGTDPFTDAISGLIAGTTYYYRAYATNSAGTGYGTIESLVAGTDTAPTRKIRLFEGFNLRIIDGKLLLYQR